MGARLAQVSNQAGPDANELLNRVVEAVESNLDRMVDAMMAAYSTHIPSYAAAGPELLADVRAGAQATVLVGVSLLRGESTPGGLENALAALGRRRAGQGVPLPDVLLAFQVGAHQFWEHLLELAPEEPTERLLVLSTGTRAMLDLLEKAVAAVSAGYQETAEERVADEEPDFTARMEGVGVAVADDPEAGARRARAAARVAVHLDRPVVRYEDVVPLANVLDGPDEERRSFVETWLGPVVTDPRGEELLRSLTEFYA